MTTNDNELREQIVKILGLETDPNGQPDFLLTRDEDFNVIEGVSYANEVDQLVQLVSESMRRREGEARKEGYDPNRLGSWIFVGDNARLENLDGLYWSYVQEFVANDNPHREEPYEKMDYIKKTMPHASFSKVGIFKLLARADQRAKERIAELKATIRKEKPDDKDV
jgi:hypothetical protein